MVIASVNTVIIVTSYNWPTSPPNPKFSYWPSGIAGWPFLCPDFLYDTSNKPAIIDFNGTKYAYVHNLQGDIVAILDSNGTAVVQYKYDAWGKPISKTGSMASTLGTVQPFRYRGYVYDEETGLYYQTNRYYSPKNSRFLNCDNHFDVNSGLHVASLYTYCANNPLIFKDESGNGLILACVIGFGILGAVIGGCLAAKESEKELGYVNGWWVAGGVVLGGALGAGTGYLFSVTSVSVAETLSSILLFGEQTIRTGEHLIQLLKKYYEGPKKPLSLSMVKELIRLCNELGVEYTAHINDLVNVVNHKTWNGIPHIHVGTSRVHVALDPEAVDFILNLLNIGGK